MILDDAHSKPRTWIPLLSCGLKPRGTSNSLAQQSSLADIRLAPPNQQDRDLANSIDIIDKGLPENAKMNRSSSPVDKQWAKKYILDPLTAPEPSQECGPGSSFASAPGRSLSVKKESSSNNKNKNPYPTPPTSSSPTRSSFKSPNQPFPSTRYPLSPSEDVERYRPALGRSNSANNHPRSPGYRPPSTGVGRSQSVRQPPSAHQNRSAAHERSNSATVDKGKGLSRSGSLSERFPGDMSHRPLDMIKRDARAADRAPHLRRKPVPDTDTIDNLDTIGGTYHHGGPYDATLMSRNTNKMYSPVEALKESNLEALRATPREYIQDALEKHVPLQGTAVIPPGGVDMKGNVMQYREGADLMREQDAPGGAYKRWDGIPYHPDDLKGKGEPSYTIERDIKENKARQRRHAPSNRGSRSGATELEMQPRSTQATSSGTSRKDLGAQVRQRSISSAATDRPQPGGSQSQVVGGYSTNNDLHRSNTTGKRITEGLKRRFGSFRRKKNHEEA